MPACSSSRVSIFAGSDSSSRDSLELNFVRGVGLGDLIGCGLFVELDHGGEDGLVLEGGVLFEGELENAAQWAQQIKSNFMETVNQLL